MPSIFDFLVKRQDSEDLIRINNQLCSSSLPPIMKVIKVSGQQNVSTSLELLPADPNKVYLVHGWWLYVTNDADNTCTQASIKVVDYFTGIDNTVDCVYMTPSASDLEQSKQLGMNIASAPNTSVRVLTNNGAPDYMTCLLYYSEVRV